MKGFDESYFLYFEDYDLSLRLAAHGAVMEHGDIHVIHHGGDAYRKGVVTYLLVHCQRGPIFSIAGAGAGSVEDKTMRYSRDD